MREVTAYDELELDTLGDRKTALFLIMSDTETDFTRIKKLYEDQLISREDYEKGEVDVHLANELGVGVNGTGLGQNLAALDLGLGNTCLLYTSRCV